MTALAVSASIATGAFAASQQAKKVYRWVDAQGQVHYGDSVPPEYADTNRQVLNEQGVAVGSQGGPAPGAADGSAAQTSAEREQARSAARRDQVLLDTYLSVEEIERLRDQRVELMNEQVNVTEHYLARLRERLAELQKEAAGFKPYSNEPAAPPIDDKLAAELGNTLDSVLLYEKNLAEARARQAALVAQFAADIERFRELKSVP